MIIERKITVGEMCTVLALFVGIVIYLSSDHNSVGQLAADVQKTNKTVEQTQTQLTAKMDGTEARLSTQIRELSTVIANIPADREKMSSLNDRETNVERRLDGVDSKLSDLSNRVTRVEATTAVPFRQTRPPP